jgi:hypothetical protein
MALCEEGYLCEVCGQDVGEIVESDLYLRYVLGEIDPETLHRRPERHIRCNPALAQFIIADDFAPLLIEGPASKAGLDPEFVAEEERRVTAAYLRLREIHASSEPIPINEYPPPGVRARWGGVRGER